MNNKLKITFIGSCNVGKTTIINRIINNNIDVLPSKNTRNTSIFVNIENTPDNISILSNDNNFNFSSIKIEDINSKIIYLNGINRKNGDFNIYTLKTKFSNIENILASNLLIQDTPGISEDFIQNKNLTLFLSNTIFNSHIIYYIFNYLELNVDDEDESNELKFFGEILEIIKINNLICLKEKYFKIIINQIDKFNEIKKNNNNITENDYNIKISTMIKNKFYKITNIEYDQEFIYTACLMKSDPNYNNYKNKIQSLLNSIENDLIKKNKIYSEFIKNTVSTVKNEIILDFNRNELDIFIKKKVDKTLEKLLNYVNTIYKNNIEKISNISTINDISKLDKEKNKNILIINLIFNDPELNRYPINYVFIKYKEYFTITRWYRLLFLLVPLNIIVGSPFGFLHGLILGIKEGISEKSLAEGLEVFKESIVNISCRICFAAYEIEKKKDKLEKSIKYGTSIDDNSKISSLSGLYFSIDDLIKEENYIYLYNTYDQNLKYKIKASYNIKTNQINIFPSVGNHVYSARYEFKKFLDEKIILMNNDLIYKQI